MVDILFLAHRVPFPPDRGDKIRSWNMLKHLGGLGTVHLGCFDDGASGPDPVAILREAVGGRLGETCVVTRPLRVPAATRALAAGKPLSLALFGSAKLHRFVRDLLGRREIEAILAFSGQMAQFVPSGRRFVMDFVDMDSAKFAAYARSGPAAMRWIHAREARRLFAFEQAVAARAATSLFVSEAEASLFRDRTGAANVRALSNGIDLDRFDPARAPRLADEERGAEPLIVFTGQMDYRPNVEAAVWFAREVLPRLRRGRFAIVGRDPTPAVRALASSRVRVTGAVEDVHAWLAAADVVVAPLGIARGIQNKVLEAMAMARPVVATAAALEGIEAEPGRDLLVAEGADGMAAAVDRLIQRSDEAACLGAAARRCMEGRYRWEDRLAPLAGMLFPSERKAAA